MFDALAIEEISYRLERADLSDGALAEVYTLQAAAAEYAPTVQRLENALRGIDGDRDLTNDAKTRRRAERIRVWALEVDELVAGLETRADAMVRNREAQVTPPPPLDRDPSANSLRLEAAKADARLMLDRVPLERLPDRMRDLAASETHREVAYLLSATPFGGVYLEHRDAPGEAKDWEKGRSKLFRGQLSPSAQRAMDDLEPLRDAAMIPASIRGLYDAARLRFGLPRSR